MKQTTVASIVEPIVNAFLADVPSLAIDFWDGSSIGSPDAKARAVFRDPEAVGTILRAPGELGLARAFVTGHIDFQGDTFLAVRELTRIDPDPSRIGVRTALKAAMGILGMGLHRRAEGAPPEEVVPNGRRHSKRRDASAVSHHYDVGNDFYRLFLGSTMAYSCARFVEDGTGLDEAQVAKFDLVARKVGLSPGMRLLDVGCGWGGMLLHAAQHYGATGVGITLSNEQASLARQRIAEAGLSDRLEVRVLDYRDLADETFDAVSSIGMFEHVGRHHMAEYFETLWGVLRPGGRLLHHAIDKPDGSAMHPDGFIARYVFPDGELQDLGTTIHAMQDAGFEVRDVESLREHYATTLQHWVCNLEHRWDDAIALVGQNRARVWWLYMTGSAAAFEANRISVHQTIGTKSTPEGSSGMPATRAGFV